MNFHITSHEQEILNNQFPDCKKLDVRGDIILVYSDDFRGDIYETANTLQAATDLLKYFTCLNPTEFFNLRIMETIQLDRNLFFLG